MKRTRLRFYLLVVAAILFLLTGPWSFAAKKEKPSRFVALRNVRIIDAKNKHTVEKGTLLIKGNMINAVGEVEKIDIPKGAEILDLKGKTLMPGLIDCHCHVLFKELGTSYDRDSDALLACSAARNLRTCLEVGVTTVRDVGGLRGITNALKRALSMKLIPGPRFYHSGEIITNTGGHGWRIAECADGKEEIVKAIRNRFTERAHKCDFIKLTWNLPQGYTDEEIQTAIETVHKYGKKIAIHAFQPETIDACVKYGADTIEHGFQIEPEIIPLAIKNKIIIVPTMYGVVKAFVEEGFELTIDGKPLEEAVKKRFLEQKKRFWKMILESLKPYVAAGGLIAMGTDCGSYPRVWTDAPNELIIYKELGLTPFQIIQAGTINGAKAIGIEDKTGTLEEGKWADIIVLDGNPLEDLTALKRLIMVILDGEIVVDNR